jgi:hypothetical protein
MRPALILIALIGCQPSHSDEECTPRTFFADVDQDGFGDADSPLEACEAPTGAVENSDDCDDANSDRTVVQDWFSDGDGDGFGDPASGPITSCDPILDGVSDGTDCDDETATINPAASEICGGGDEDCDALLDDADPSVDLTTGSSFWQDGDGDGYGDAAAEVVACAQPTGTSTNDLDCDDGDAAVLGAVDLFLDADGDGFGDDATLTSSCDPIAGFITTNGDCNDADADVSPDAVERCGDATDNDCDGEVACYEGEIPLSDANASVGATVSSFLGAVLAGPGDVDGDGYADLFVGNTYGYSYVLRGPLDGYVDTGTAWASFSGDLLSAGGAGDQDGDGLPDLILGADFGGYTTGAYVLVGVMAGAIDPGTAIALTSPTLSDDAGSCVGPIGDLDGDGDSDLFIGAVRDASVATDSGAIYVVSGPVTASASLGDARAMFTGEGKNSEAGRSADGAGDVDGDGLDDLLVGAPRGTYTSATEVGRAYLVLGPADTSGTLGDVAHAVIAGTTSAEELGYGVAGIGDVDGDGYADFALGAPNASSGKGRVYLFHGPISGSLSYTSAIGRYDGDGGDFGASMDLVGDVDADGHPDLLIGASNYYGVGRDGRAYLYDATFTGTGSTPIATFVAGTDERAGRPVVALGDMDGDRFPDFALGASEAASKDGRAYIWYGGGP